MFAQVLTFTLAALGKASCSRSAQASQPLSLVATLPAAEGSDSCASEESAMVTAPWTAGTGKSLGQEANICLLERIHLYPERQNDGGKEYVCTFQSDRHGFKFNTTIHTYCGVVWGKL